MGSNKAQFGIITFNKPVDAAAENVAIKRVGGLFKMSDDKTLMIFDNDSQGKCYVEEYLKELIAVLSPLGYILNGKLDCINTDYLNLYGVFVKNNKITVKDASKITYTNTATSKWNLVAKTFDLAPFHIPSKLLSALIAPKPVEHLSKFERRKRLRDQRARGLWA